MNTEIIKQYIQFAIDNGLKNIDFNVSYDNFYLDFDFSNNVEFETKMGDIAINYIELITSKEFIEAIIEGFKIKLGNEWEDNNFGYKYKGKLYEYKDFIDKITTEQAIHIRDNNLEYFISNLLKDIYDYYIGIRGNNFYELVDNRSGKVIEISKNKQDLINECINLQLNYIDYA